MNGENHRSGEDVLDRATAGLRNAAIPPGPSPQLLASTVESLNALHRNADQANRRRSIMFRIAGYSGLAAAIVAIAFVAGLLFRTDGAGGVAFADVLENVKKSNSFTFVNRQKVGSQKPIEFQCYVLGDRFRMEMSNVFVVVGDFGKKKAMELNPATKTATMIDITDDTAAAWFGFLRKLRQAKPQDVQPAGEKVVDGEKVLVYEYETEMPIIGSGKIPIVIEVDPETKLPTRMVVEGFGKSQSGGEGFLVFEDFDWKAELDPGMFALEPPPGYQVVERRADVP